MRHFADPVACVRRQVFGDQTESNRMFRRPLCCAEVFAMLSIAKTLFGSLLVAGCLSCAAQDQGLSEPTLDAAHAAEIDARVLSIGHPRDEAIASFTERLVAGLETPRERLYAIYRWVARYIDYDVESYLSGRLMGAGGAENTFRSGRSVCNGYADLLVAMGKAAGLRIEKVEGHAKGFGPGLTTASLQDKENHAWNAVELDGRWVTPPLACGLLPGVMRQTLLAHGRIEEATIHLDDLHRATGLALINSVRGWLPAQLLKD